MDVAVAVLLYFQAKVLIKASTFAPGTSQGDVGATERFFPSSATDLGCFPDTNMA